MSSKNSEIKPLTPEDFGVESRWGYGKVQMTEEGRAKIQDLLAEQKGKAPADDGIHYVGVDDVGRAAIAHFQFRRDVHYYVADIVVDGEPQRIVCLIDEVNGRVQAKIKDQELSSDVRVSENIHQALEAKENVDALAKGERGVEIRHDAESSKETSSQQHYKERRELGDEIYGISGTLTDSSELMAENLDGQGVHVRIERYNESNLHEEDAMMFEDQEAKRAWLVEEIKGARETGEAVVVGADRNDKPRALSKLLTEMGIPHQVIGDAQYQVEHDQIEGGAVWEKDMETDLEDVSGLAEDGKGRVTLLCQTGGAGLT